MIDGSFSADAFARLGPDTPEAEQLSDALSGEIAVEMREAVEGVIRRVVEQLRALGHDLREVARAPRTQFPACEYSFCPGDPLPPEGWLAIHFDISALVIYSQADAEQAARVPAEQEPEAMAPDEEVPF